MPPKHLTVYITGHGYGHATRTVEVLAEVRRRLPGLRLSIRTTVAPEILRRRFAESFEYARVALDVGAAERNTLDVDEGRTLAAWQSLWARREEILAREVDFLRREGADAVLFDIPPLAAEAAARAGIPSIACSSFSWDEIYKPYAVARPAFWPIIREIEAMYRRTTLLLQLRLGTAMPAFPRRIQVPAVGRRSNAVRDQVRAELGIRKDERVVLVALRDRYVSDPERLGRDAGVCLLLPGASRPIRTEHTLAPGPAWEPRFADMMVASDAVLSKAGYGILAECLANRRPLLHFRRRNFAEWPALLAEMDRLMPHRLLEPDSFDGTTLAHALDACLSGPEFRPVAINGASVSARHITAFLLQET